MEKIILYLQCRDYPMWTIDEEQGLRMPGLPAYLSMPDGLEPILVELQSTYDTLFSMHGEAMAFDGIPSEDFRSHLLDLSQQAERLLKANYPTFEIENRIPALLLNCPLALQN